MALYLYDDLPTALAKSVARQIWVNSYTVATLVIDGFTISTPVIWSDTEIEDALREDAQAVGFLWKDDGSAGF